MEAYIISLLKIIQKRNISSYKGFVKELEEAGLFHLLVSIPSTLGRIASTHIAYICAPGCKPSSANSTASSLELVELWDVGIDVVP